MNANKFEKGVEVKSRNFKPSKVAMAVRVALGAWGYHLRDLEQPHGNN